MESSRSRRLQGEAPEISFREAFTPPCEHASLSREALAARGESAKLVGERADPLDCVYFQKQAQVEAFIKHLEGQTVNDKPALAHGIATVNDMLRTYAQNHALLHEKWNGKSRDHAVTVCTWARGLGGVESFVARPPKKDPAHGDVYRKIWAGLCALGVGPSASQSGSGRVTGVFARVAIAGPYDGYVGCGQVTPISPAVSVVHKLMIVASSRGQVEPIAKDLVSCTFADGSMTERKSGHALVDMNAGSFAGAKRGVAELCPSYQNPRDAKSMFHYLFSEQLDADAWMFIGVAGQAWQADAVARGAFSGDVFSCGGFDAFKMSISGVCAPSDPPASLPVALAALKELQPTVFEVYDVMAKFGELTLTLRPRGKTRPYQVISRVLNWLRDLREAHSPLIKGFDVGVGVGPVVYAPKKVYQNMITWQPDWSLAKKVAKLAGVATVADLTLVDDKIEEPVVVGDGRFREARAVPKAMTQPSPGGKSFKKRKVQAPEAKEGPRVFKCCRKDGACGFEWSPDTPLTATRAFCPKCTGRAVPKEAC